MRASGPMPDSHYMAFKLIFEVPTGRILGAQAIGPGSADKRVDVIAALIMMGGTLEDLKEDVMQLAKLLSPEPKETLNLDVV